MKRFIALILAAFMMFSLCACGQPDIPEKFVADKESLGNRAFVEEMTWDEVVDYDMTISFRPGDSANANTFSWKLNLSTASETLDTLYWDWVFDLIDSLDAGEITDAEYAIFDEYTFDDWYQKVYSNGSVKIEKEIETVSYLVCSGNYIVNDNNTITVNVNVNENSMISRVLGDVHVLTFMINEDGSLEFEANDRGQLYTLNFIAA